MERLLWLLMALNGFLAVSLGAFGAHGLKGYLAAAENGALRLGWWGTAADYHLAHTFALGFSAYLCSQHGSLPAYGGIAFQVGIILFSGSLYAMTLTNVSALGAVTPIGGLALLGGWACLAISAIRSHG